MGAWIEIDIMSPEADNNPSLPLWERGLKCIPQDVLENPLFVAPLVGAWIEISGFLSLSPYHCVAPLVGAWIEIISAC